MSEKTWRRCNSGASDRPGLVTHFSGYQPATESVTLSVRSTVSVLSTNLTSADVLLSYRVLGRPRGSGRTNTLGVRVRPPTGATTQVRFVSDVNQFICRVEVGPLIGVGALLGRRRGGEGVRDPCRPGLTWVVSGPVALLERVRVKGFGGPSKSLCFCLVNKRFLFGLIHRNLRDVGILRKAEALVLRGSDPTGDPQTPSYSRYWTDVLEVEDGVGGGP